jgi:hypothetical protein
MSQVFNKNSSVAPFEDITPKKLNFKQATPPPDENVEKVEKAEEVKKEEAKQQQ